MKKYPSPQEWAEEFKNFATAEELHPPREVSERIFSQIRADLNPSAWFVFAKLALIHLVMGTVTLLFCPQFGIQLGGAGLMGYLMRFGEKVCMLGCGAEFLAGTALVAALVLRPEEVRIIRKTELLQLSALGLLSLGAFICLGEGVLLSLAVFWLLGSVVAGLATLELGWFVRRLAFGR